MTRRVVAIQDPSLRARVVRTVPLHYAAGADEALDRPAHVRAGSGVTWAGSSLLVVQDDANFFAVVNPRDGAVESVPLPAGAGGLRQFDDTRGNKADKLDLEAVVSVPMPGAGAVVLAFGSGSTTRRESVVSWRGLGGVGEVGEVGDGGSAVADVIPLPRFYAGLRNAVSFAGSELNVEAVVYLGAAPGGQLRLFNRGNGAPRDGLLPVDATCDVEWAALAAHLANPNASDPPPARDVVQYALGDIGGLPLTFTDATPVPASGDAEARRRILYTAAAEASPDATRDGPVAGCAVGVIREGPAGVSARWTLLEGRDGAPFVAKVEGIALHADDPFRAFVVLDRDDPSEPAELGEVVLEGPWFSVRATHS